MPDERTWLEFVERNGLATGIVVTLLGLFAWACIRAFGTDGWLSTACKTISTAAVDLFGTVKASVATTSENVRLLSEANAQQLDGDVKRDGVLAEMTEHDRRLVRALERTLDGARAALHTLGVEEAVEHIEAAKEELRHPKGGAV